MGKRPEVLVHNIQWPVASDPLQLLLVVLERDPLKNVRNVFASVGSRFEVLVNFFPLDHSDRIGFFFE
jgi:hypothetical protein